MRLDSDGVRDSSFGVSGLITFDLAGSDEEIDALVVQPDGKIVVGGRAGDAPAMDLAVVRFDADGAPDPGFGSGGVARTDLGGGEYGLALALEGGGALVLGGFDDTGGLIVRYGVDGTPDPSFGTGGVARVPGLAAVSDLIARPDGTLLAAGSYPSAFVARFDADGVPDPSFGAGGFARVPWLAASHLRLVAAEAGALTIAGTVRMLGAGYAGTFGIGLAQIFGGACGDGVTDAGEECDDGNVLGGDGCDPSCCLADADGDGRCDSLDACLGGVAVARPQVIVRGDNDTLTFKGEMTLPHPFVPALDPAANGVRVILHDVGGNLIDAFVPPGAFTRESGVGWKVSVGRWSWIDKTLTNPFGIDKVVVQDRSSRQPGLVKFVVKSRKRTYSEFTQHPPLSGVLVLDVPQATGGQCGTATFPGPPPAPTCTPMGPTLVCR